MSLFMDLDDSWLPSGSQMIVDDELFFNATLAPWGGYNVSASTQVNEFVTVHPSITAIHAVDYSMDIGSISESKSMVTSYSDSSLDEQCALESLPGSPEMGHMTELQLRQHVSMLDIVPDVLFTNTSSKSPVIISGGQQVWKHFEAICPETLDLESDCGVTVISGNTVATVATVPECETNADVLGLLDQLTDEMDSDIFIDPADLEAFVSYPLHPVSPDDIESLLSSQLSAVDTQVIASASSSFFSPSSETSIPEAFSPSWEATENMHVASPFHVQHVDKRRKKQDQNKSAALRYREKKRSEHGTVLTECEELEKRNIELKTKVAEMTKEVDYLKGLIEEICAV